jgi:hypothetical protein
MTAQLSPLSLINFNRCSSAGVHGVFTLDFLTTGEGLIIAGAEVVWVSGAPIDMEADIFGGGIELDSGLCSGIWECM